jgi:hypothetical protein
VRNGDDTLEDKVLYLHKFDLLKVVQFNLCMLHLIVQIIVTAHYYLLLPLARVTKEGHQALMKFLFMNDA